MTVMILLMVLIKVAVVIIFSVLTPIIIGVRTLKTIIIMILIVNNIIRKIKTRKK